MTEEKKKWKKAVCYDFDGVVNSYTSGWQGPTVLHDDPVPGAFEAIIAFLDAEFDVFIFSTRTKYDGGIEAIKAWFEMRGFPLDRIGELQFPTDKPSAIVYIDDRAFQFNGVFPTPEEVERFQPWYKRDPSQSDVIIFGPDPEDITKWLDDQAAFFNGEIDLEESEGVEDVGEKMAEAASEIRKLRGMLIQERTAANHGRLRIPRRAQQVIKDCGDSRDFVLDQVREEMSKPGASFSLMRRVAPTTTGGRPLPITHLSLDIYIDESEGGEVGN